LRKTKIQLFFPPKREEKEEKKDYARLTAMERRLSRFFEKKYYPKGGDFFSKTRRA